jgi:hypothetical protein
MHGVINCQNCRTCGSEVPYALVEDVHENPKINVWSSIISDRTVGPCFFHKTIIMRAVYLGMLENLVYPQIIAEVDGLIFQQDGAPAHFDAIVCTALDKRFPG